MEARLATMEADGWELSDAEEIARAHPDTFWIPPREVRQQLQPGQQVKLIFRIATMDEDDQEQVSVERMWVVVTGRLDELYRGELDNQPYCTDDMSPGMPVWFEARHVINVFAEGEEGEEEEGG